VVRLFVAGRPFGQITTSSATEDEGRFAFDYVPAGAVVLEAQDPLTARTGRATGSLASEGEVLELDVVAQALGTVEGLVTSNDAPQPGALVEITSGAFKATTDTDGEGRYRLVGVPGGRVVAKASLAQGFLAGTAAGDLTEDGSVLGLDVERLLDGAEALAQASASCIAPADNPGVWLGAILGELAKAGRDKVTLVPSPALAAFGTWVEQLLAESTGKEGRGLIPIDREPLSASGGYGDDRLFVHLHLEGQADGLDEKLRLEAAGHPSSASG
jgi:hypothetical protein